MDRVYILKAKLLDNPDQHIYKIGKSSGKNSMDRLMQIQRAFFMKYRYTPFTTIKRDRACNNAFEVESKLHKKFKKLNYYHDKKHDGSTEWFYIDREDLLLQAYDELIPTSK